MAIKLRNLSDNLFIRGLLILLCAAMVTASIFLFLGVYLTENEFDLTLTELLSAASYEESPAITRDLRNWGQRALLLADELKSEAYIKSGGSISAEELDEMKRELFYSVQYETSDYGGIPFLTNENSASSESEEVVGAEDSDGWAMTGYDWGDWYNLEYSDYDTNPVLRRWFETNYQDRIDQLEDQLIQQNLHTYQRLSQALEAENGFHYYIYDGAEAYSNLAEVTGPERMRNLFAGYGCYVFYEEGRYTAFPETLNNQGYYSSYLRSMVSDYYSQNYTVYMGFDDQYLNARKLAFANARQNMETMVVLCGLTLLGGLVLLTLLTMTAGRRLNDGRIHLRGLGKWYSELLVAGAFFLPLLAAVFLNEFQYLGYSSSWYYDDYYGSSVYYGGISSSYFTSLQWTAMALGFFIGTILFLQVFLALVEKWKAKRILKDSLLWRMGSAVGRGIRDVYTGGPVMMKVTVAILLICLLSATIVFMPFAAAAAIFFAVRILKQYEAIKKGVGEVKSGNLSYQIPDLGKSGKAELSGLAQDINEISQGFDLAVKQELKNQRLKTELISNVSHDIKTPLTSIITYVDLLKKEGTESAEGQKYLDILAQKSQRLKNLTEDLFEAAKASSGDIPVNFAKVELLSLINQGLGEMNDRLYERGLDVILKNEQEKYYVNADGQLLWRVVENLLGNIIKYAQKNSRVYIDLRQDFRASDGQTLAILEMKNISENPLNIPADELMERFKRGDDARTTEGSGLGLAIAKDLTNMQNGRFEIFIDGDLFKVVVTLEMYEGA